MVHEIIKWIVSFIPLSVSFFVSIFLENPFFMIVGAILTLLIKFNFNNDEEESKIIPDGCEYKLEGAN